MNGCFSASFQSVVLVVPLVYWPLVLLNDLITGHGSSLHLLHLRDCDGLLLLAHFLDDLRDYRFNPPGLWQVSCIINRLPSLIAEVVTGIVFTTWVVVTGTVFTT